MLKWRDKKQNKTRCRKDDELYEREQRIEYEEALEEKGHARKRRV